MSACIDNNNKIVFFLPSVFQILPGNVNTYLPVNQELELPFVASRIRFVPFSPHPRTVCMRVEIYGCPWERKYIWHFVLFPAKDDVDPKGAYKGEKRSIRARYPHGRDLSYGVRTRTAVRPTDLWIYDELKNSFLSSRNLYNIYAVSMSVRKDNNCTRAHCVRTTRRSRSP